jgi:hypothetical protein
MQIVSTITCVIALLVAAIVVIFSAWLLAVNEFSFKSFAFFYPALGGLRVTGYYIMKDVLPQKNKESTSVREFFQLYEKGSAFIHFFTRAINNDANASKFRGYWSAMFLQDHYLKDKNPKPSEIPNEDFVDIVECAVISWIASYFRENWTFVNGLGGPNDETNTKLQVSFLIAQNQINPLIASPVIQALKNDALHLPPNTTVTYFGSRAGERRVREYTFENPVSKLKVSIFDMGIDNFNPSRNDFEKFMAFNAKSNIDSDFVLKKTGISVAYTLKRFRNFRDDDIFFERWYEKLIQDFDKDFSWDLVSAKLKQEFSSRNYVQWDKARSR